MKLYYAFMDLEKAFDRVPREVGMDEWLIRTVMPLYTVVYTVVKTDAGLSESFYVKVGLHQGSVLSQLLFAVVMDVVSGEARSGLPSELLYSDNLYLWHQQWSSLVDVWLNGEIAFLTKWWKDNCKIWKVTLWCLWERRTGKLCSVHSMYVVDSQAV